MRPVLYLSLSLTAWAQGCADVEKTPPDRLTVAVSIPPQAYLVEQIGGPRVHVLIALRAGDSAETFQPADHDITRLMQAAVYFRIGVESENTPWFGAIGSVAGGPRIVDLRTEREPPADRHGLGHDPDPDGADPHVWLSPPLLKVQARTIARALIELDPEHAAQYRARRDGLLSRLDELDAHLRRVLAPVRGRRFYVYHPSWGHFAEAYGLHQVAIESDGKPASDFELTRLLESARADGARVIFVQPQVRGKSARLVADVLGARVVVIDPLARDVDANLRAVAAAIRESLRE